MAIAAMAHNYHNTQETNSDFSDFLDFNDWVEDDPPFSSSRQGNYNTTTTPNPPYQLVDASSGGITNSFHPGTSNRESGSGKDKKETREKVAFRTQSNIEVLADGYKWRKYGKKMVKNSPNPRNYYRCSVEGCPVKKRVEREKEDPRYVVTTYEGIHNHQGPKH